MANAQETARLQASLASAGADAASKADFSKLSDAIAAYVKRVEQAAAAAAESEKALQAVAVKKEDVVLLETQFEIPKATADRILRECGGSVDAALALLLG